MVGVPRVWEKIQEKMLEIGAGSSPLKKRIGAWAKAISLDNQLKCQTDPEHKESLQYKLANALILR